MAMRHTIISGPRWLGRMAVMSVTLAMLMMAAWCAWMWEMTRRCDAFVAAARARGERVTWDVQPFPDVPDEQNSAHYLQLAGNALVLPPPATPTYQQWLASDAATRSASRPAPVSWQMPAKGNVARNAMALALVRKARQCTHTQWTPVPPAGFPVFTNFVGVAKLVRDDALLHHEVGEGQQAVDCWRDIDGEMRSVASGTNTLIGGLIALIVDGIGIETMNTIAPDIHIGTPGGVSRDEVRRLIAELLDDSTTPNAVATGILSERTFGTNAYLKGTYSASPLLMRPLLYSQMYAQWHLLDMLARDAQEMRASPPIEPDVYMRLIGIIPQLPNASKDAIWMVLQRRVVALTLAIQLRRTETGRYPATLDELVPAYLKSVPVYPDASSGRAIRYLLAADGRRPVIYIALSGVKPAEVLKGLPRTRSVLASSSSPPESVGYFDASAWDETAKPSTRESLADHDQQSDARRQGDQPNADGQKK